MSATDRIRFRLPRRTPGEWSGIGFAGIDPTAIGIVVSGQGHPFPEVAPKALHMDDVALICELVNNAEALCDLADAARDAIDHYEHCAVCGDHVDNCRCVASDVRVALARLDEEDG